MLEVKFKELVNSFLDGEISTIEIGWLADDLRRNENRRILFRNELELHMATSEILAGDHRKAQFERLLEEDLSVVRDVTLQRFVPRKLAGARPALSKHVEVQFAERNQKAIPNAYLVDDTSDEVLVKSRREINWMPAFGICLLLGFFVYLYMSTGQDNTRGGSVVETASVGGSSAASSERSGGNSNLGVLYRLAGFTSQSEPSRIVEAEDSSEQGDSEDDSVPVFLKVETNEESPTGFEFATLRSANVGSGSTYRYLPESLTSTLQDP